MASTKTALPAFPERSKMQKSKFHRLKLERMRFEQESLYNSSLIPKRYDHAFH